MSIGLQDSSHGQSGWQSVRTILDALILCGVLWIASTVQDQARSSAILQTQMSVQIAEVQTLRAQINDVSTLARTIAQIQVRVENIERRTESFERARTK